MKNTPRILVVDDDHALVDLLERLLVHKEYEVLKAYSGEEALKIVSEESVDLVLLDIELPGVDGIWVTRRLRQDEKTRMIPIIMITGHAEKEYKIKGIEAGADDFITKPVDIDEVLARVRTSLDLSYYRRQLHEKDELETLIKETIDGVVICSPDWIIEEMNDSAQKCLNLQQQKNTNLLDFIFSDFSVSVPRKELADMSLTHKTFYIIKKGTENQKPVYLLASLDIFRVPTGEPTSILLDLRNVTEQHI
ncbi:PleD family two-component system response regulator [Candidatus Omnitrophota bacterium]